MVPNLKKIQITDLKKNTNNKSDFSGQEIYSVIYNGAAVKQLVVPHIPKTPIPAPLPLKSCLSKAFKRLGTLSDQNHVMFNNIVVEFHQKAENLFTKTYGVLRNHEQQSKLSKRIGSFQDIGEYRLCNKNLLLLKNIAGGTGGTDTTKNKLVKNSHENCKLNGIFLTEQFKKILLQNLNAFVTIGNITFNCNLHILSIYSPIFVSLSTELFINLPKHVISPKAFEVVYEWMLTENAKVSPRNILDIFQAANFLKIKSLVRQCWACFDSDIVFVECTAFLFFLEIKKRPEDEHLKVLKQLFLTRVRKFFTTLVVSTDYLALEESEVITLLSSNQIAVHNEIEVFFAALRWLNKDWKRRKNSVEKILGCVRFEMFQFLFLIILNRQIVCKKIRRVIAYPAVQKKINDAIIYLTTLLYCTEDEDFDAYIMRNKLKPPMPRRFVRDTKYHIYKPFEGLLHINFSYAAFILYIRNLRKAAKVYWTKLVYTDVTTNKRKKKLNDKSKEKEKSV